MNVLIVDDEQPARERLRRLLDSLDEYTVAGEASNGVEAIEQYNAFKPEIVLLDIRMPVMDGLEAARHLAADATPPGVIFTTAYGDHALEAFETQAVDYLLKPVRKERLLAALSSAQRRNRAQVASVRHQSGQARRHICVRHRGNLILIAIEDILYFQAADKYVTLYHRGGQALVEESLVQLEEEFGDRFIRVHRNALIAADQLCGLEKTADTTTRIRLRDSDDRVEVSRRHLPAVRRLLKELSNPQ